LVRDLFALVSHYCGKPLRGNKTKKKLIVDDVRYGGWVLRSTL